MKPPCYIGIPQAQRVLADMGVELSDRQIKRAAEPDANGQRKLPFFVDPIEGKLKIEKGTLMNIYRQAQLEAENGAKLRAHFNSSLTDSTDSAT